MKFFPFLTVFFLSVFSFTSFSQSDPVKAGSIAINNFIVKENLLKNDKIAIIACDESERPLENISGIFQFSINGFKQVLKFNDGVAISPQQIDKSTFIYLRHENESGTHSKLYYVLKKESDLRLFKINWLILVFVPLIIIFLATMFRKFILIAVVLLILLYFFNTSNGLNIPTFFQTVFDGLKSVF
ncbi:hypothetical protein [Daejeonella oryzae]|uniref:hypothetical protein n=1 Tax=Daejeonella oryzae TaxID=1122943 RepID=UPI000428CE90|nr:hypothetical protein [Daejeonella oryzae]